MLYPCKLTKKRHSQAIPSLGTEIAGARKQF